MIEQDQIFAGRLTGNCNHTRTEYDNLTGYVVKEYTVEWTDSSGNLWRKTCTVINLGRPDRGIPVDPDEAIADEPWSEKPADAYRLASAVWHGKMQYRIVGHLAGQGADTIQSIVDSLDMSYPSVVKHMREREGSIYCRVGKIGNTILWGVVGVHDKEAA